MPQSLQQQLKELNTYNQEFDACVIPKCLPKWTASCRH